MFTTWNLSHADAQRMIATVQQALEKEKKTACIAVADSHGELIAFLRMDGCRLPSVSISMNKAFTAARETRASGEIGKSSRTEGFPMTNFGDIRYTGWAGGFPVKHEGVVIGAVGVSGLTEAEDLELARRAAALVS